MKSQPLAYLMASLPKSTEITPIPLKNMNCSSQSPLGVALGSPLGSAHAVGAQQDTRLSSCMLPAGWLTPESWASPHLFAIRNRAQILMVMGPRLQSSPVGWSAAAFPHQMCLGDFRPWSYVFGRAPTG